MRKFLAGFLVGLIIGLAVGMVYPASAHAQSAPPAATEEARPTLRIITKVTDKDAVGSLFIAGVKRDLVEGLNADVTTGDALDTNDPTGPELRVMAVVTKGSSEETIVAVLTYHVQGVDMPPMFLAVAAGSVDADSAQEAADEVSRMIVLVVSGLEGDLKTKPQATPKIPSTKPQTAILQTRAIA